HVIATRRNNRKSDKIEVHYFRPERGFKRTLAGTDPATPHYQRSLVKAQDDYQRWLASGRPKATGQRNAKGSLLDENNMAITKPERATTPVEEPSVAWLVRQFLASAQAKALKPSTYSRFDNLLQRMCALPWPKAGPGAVVGGAAFASMRKDHMLAIRQHFPESPAHARYLVKRGRA